MKATVSIINVTVPMAEKMLANLFPGQRPVRESYIIRLWNEMDTPGQWRLSPDCLVKIKGKTANGQHRLHALIRAKKSQKFLIMETDDDELYKIMDCGAKRSVADVIQGEHPGHVAATARNIVLYDLDALSFNSGGSGKTREGLSATRSLCIEFAEAHHNILLQIVSMCVACSAKSKIVPVSMAAALVFVAKRDLPGNDESIEQFIKTLYSGESQNDAARDLRERIIRAHMGTARLPRWHIFALLIKSLKSYLNGTRLAQVRINEGEKFPRLK